MTKPCSCRQQKASGQQIEPRSAKHLALEQLQAVDLAFDGALTPGQGHGGLDGGPVGPKPFGKASERGEGALGGTHEPRFELGRLALADEGGEVLRECHRLCQFRQLPGQLRQLVVILRRRPLRRTEDQPDGPTRGEQAPWRLRHCRQRLIATALVGCWR
jgi:hypothetical protein